MKAILFLVLVYYWQSNVGARMMWAKRKNALPISAVNKKNSIFGGQDARLKCSPNVCNINEDCVVKNNRAMCVCKPGRAGNCNVKVREACVSGDPSYNTFDGFQANYHGTCPVVLTQNRQKIVNFPDFQVVVTNKLVSPGSSFSSIDVVEVTIYGQTIAVDRSKRLYRNGVLTAVPFVWPSEQSKQIRVTLTGDKFVIETEHNLKVVVQSRQACVMLPESLRGQNTLMGLFGNIDDNRNNEMICRDGSNQQGSEKSTLQFNYKHTPQFLKCQDSYITKRTFGCFSGLELQTKNNKCNLKDYWKDCALILYAASGRGPFALCKVLGETVINHEYEDCLRALCAGAGAKCIQYNSLVNRCKKSIPPGSSIGNWRTQTKCPMECGPNSVYKECSSACPKTCANLEFLVTCNQNCIENCECLPGYVVDNTETSYVKCVKEDECGCVGPQEMWHPANKNFLNDQCNLYSGCFGGQYFSKSISCAKNAACSVKDGIRQCLCNAGYVGDGYTCGLNNTSGSVIIVNPPKCNICASFPCQNGGTCAVDVKDACHSYRCECSNPFSGNNCQFQHECLEGTCAKNANCKIEDSKAVCTCPHKYAGDPYKSGCLPYTTTKFIGNVVTQFNGFSTPFNGTCPLLFLKNKSNSQEGITLIIRQSGINGAPVITAIKEFELTLANQTILMDDKKRVYIDGNPITMPYYYPRKKNYKFSIEQTLTSMIVCVPFSYIIEFGTETGLEVSVPIDNDTQNKIIFEGIAGNVGDTSGFVCRDGSLVKQPTNEKEKLDMAKCIDSWAEPMKKKTNAKCFTGEKMLEHTNITKCNTILPATECDAIKQVQDRKGPFAKCQVLGETIIEHYFEDCVHAVCIDSLLKCDMIASFASACEDELQRSLDSWRSEVNCSQQSCNEPNTEFKKCASPCQDTCAQRHRQICDKSCRDSCVCKPGFIIDNTVTDRLKCIRESECGCSDQDGKWYHAGSQWLSNKCRTSNKCQDGALQATLIECDNNAECSEENGRQTCKCLDGYKGDGHTCNAVHDERATRKPLKIYTACSSEPCNNGGECILVNNDPYIQFRCKCQKNYTGAFCDELAKDCAGMLCDQNARCIENTSDKICKCNTGYEGNGLICTLIESNIVSIAETTIDYTIGSTKIVTTSKPEYDICLTAPCRNNGICIRDNDHPGMKFACKCPSNFGGSFCDDLLECDKDTCGTNASCTVMNNKVDCVCKKGYAGNPFKSCSKIRSACVAQDPHLKTFDGLEVDYHGTCPYLFTSSCGKSVDEHTPFQVVLKNHLSDGDGERYLSWVYESEVELFNQTIHIDMYSEELMVNQVKQNPPFYWPDKINPKITILFRARTYSIKTIDGLEFTFGNYKFCANLPETTGMKEPGALCGIAGNIDDKWENDVFCRNKSVVKLDKQDYKFDFSNPELQKCQDTWITTMKTVKRDHSKCQTSVTLGKLYMNSSCDVEVPTKLCHPIKQAMSKSGPFGICSVMGDHAIEGLYQDCIVEICPNTTHLCRELKVFASACRDILPQDMDMGNWRKDTGCEMQCPANSVYSTCKSACPETCAENGKPTCDKGCVEGCQCNPGYVLDNTVNEVIKCIKKEDCGCTDQNGNWHRGRSLQPFKSLIFSASKPFYTNDCQFINQCENGTLVEKSHKCGKNAECVTANSRMRCYCKYGFAGDGYECSEITKTKEKIGVPVTCYPGWKYFKITNKCYRNYDKSLVTYEEGKRVCSRNAAEPVSINIREEMDFLIETFGQGTSTEKLLAWIGLNSKNDIWQWLDGTKLVLNWNSKAKKTSECAQLNLSSSEYMDENCDSKAAMICEAFPIVSSVCDS